ncbi:MAG: HEAT repeat domain-containing protein [Planctomycetota bacterium]
MMGIICSQNGARAQSQPATAVPESSKDHLDRLQVYRTRVLDPQARPDERRNWAEALLQETLRVQSPQSKTMVVELLNPPHHMDARRAICEAIASAAGPQSDRLDSSFVGPLVELLGADLVEVRAAASRALAEFPGVEVPDKLAELAANTTAPMIQRQAAIDALAPNVYRREVVMQLLELLDVGTPDIIGRVLSTLEPASMEPIGPDVGKWRTWWAERSRMNSEEWNSYQVRTYRDRFRTIKIETDLEREKSKRAQSDLGTRLRDFQRELFRVLPADQREARMVEWLADAQDDVKLTALAIVKGRIADEGKRPEGDVLAAMLKLLKQGSPPMRREVLSILQNLNDAAIARTVLAHLEEETDPGVREALFRAVSKLNITEAIPVLIREIGSAESPPSAVREAAAALGRLAVQPGAAERSREALGSLRERYRATAQTDVALRAGLLSAMAGIGDPSCVDEFLEGVESEEATLIRPAIQGLQSIGNSVRLGRIRRHTSHGDPLVRIAAIEAVAQLGREDADIESLLARVNPGVEANELAREAAWRGFRGLLRHRPLRERIRAVAMLRDVPDREVEYLMELAEGLSSAENAAELEIVRDRLSGLLVAQGKFGDAVPHLRELYLVRTKRNDPTALDCGLRLLDATLHTSGFSNSPELLKQLSSAAGSDEYVIIRIVETVAQYLDSPEMVADSTRTRAALTELRTVPSNQFGQSWRQLLQRVQTRLENENANSTKPP